MITAGEDGVYLDISVQAKARRAGVRGVQGERLKIAVSQPAEGGKANKAVVETIARHFGVKTGAVSIVGGKTSSKKRVFIRGVGADEALRRVST